MAPNKIYADRCFKGVAATINKLYLFIEIPIHLYKLLVKKPQCLGKKQTLSE